MGNLDVVLADVGTQFGISNSKTTSLLSGVIALFTESPGGLNAFLDRLRKAGLNDFVSSWIGDSIPRPIASNTLASAIGRDTVDKIAAKAGLSFATASSALAFMLPNIIQRLTLGGVIPARLPLDVVPSISPATSTAGRPGRPIFRWSLLAVFPIFLLGYWLWSSRAPDPPFGVGEQIREAAQNATAALEALRPGFTAQDLVSALNLNVINFPTGSAQIPTNQFDFLNKVATAIKSAPSNTVLEIAGHTDNTGDSEGNGLLSQQRAEAVRNYLVKQGVNPNTLIPKGYGDTQPAGFNKAEEGKFRNRRIEFNVRSPWGSRSLLSAP